ncbi:MAG: chitobiase/beta-hexosaminidase C-terminal domain-containing protein, partial [Muribaculaceae bacterium]
MNKFYLTLLAIATTVSAAFAEVVTIDFTDTEQLAAMGYTAPTTNLKIANGSEFKQGNFTFTSVSGSNRIYNSAAAATPGLEFRGYKGGSLKFSAAEGLVIKKIEFTGAILTNPVTASLGSYVLGENSGNFNTATWIGDDAEMTFTLGGNMSITKMVVTLDGPSAVRYPAITPNGGIYYSGMNAPVAVAITTPTEGAKVMYKTTQAPEYQEYTAPISVAESTVVTAKAVLGDVETIEVSSTFTVYPATGVASVAEFNALENGTNAYFTVPLYVCHQQADLYGKYVIATDGSGYVVLQGDIAKTVSNGDKLPAGVGGQVAINTDSYYNRVLKLEVSTVKDATPSHAVLPETVTIGQITEAYDSHYVYLKNVTVTPIDSWDATFADATGSIKAYDLMTKFPSPLAGTYNITGVVTVEASLDGNTLKVFPISFEAVESTFTFIDFSNTEQFGITAPASGKYVNVPDGTSFTVDGITFTSVKSGTTNTRFYNSTAAASKGVELRVYKPGQFKVAAPEGMAIKKIVFKGATIYAPEVSCGVFTLGSKMDGFYEAEWIGDDTEVTFTLTSAGNMFIKTATIYVAPQSAVRYPSFAQSAETFIDGVNLPGTVTITSATEGATIK